MKRKFLVGLLILAVLLSIGAKKQTERERMGIFISNFTEQGLYNFDIERDGDDDVLHLGDPENMGDLVRFGIAHNIINKPKSTLKKCKDKKCEYGPDTMTAEAVATSVKKYFDLNVRHKSVLGDAPEADFDGKLYHFDRKDWVSDTIYYADVQKVEYEGKVITMSGELYNLHKKSERPATFTATAKPHRWNKKDTWAILSLSVDWR